MRVNLIPPEDRYRPRMVRPEPLFVALAIGLGALMAAATVFSHQQGSLAAGRADSLQRAVARLEPYRKQVVDLRRETRELEKATTELEQRLKARGPGRGVAWLLQHVSATAAHAGTVWLDRISLTQDRVQVEGRADSPRAVSHFLSHLTEHARLQVAQGGVGLSEGEADGRVRFAVELRVVEVGGDGGSPAVPR